MFKDDMTQYDHAATSTGRPRGDTRVTKPTPTGQTWIQVTYFTLTQTASWASEMTINYRFYDATQPRLSSVIERKTYNWRTTIQKTSAVIVKYSLTKTATTPYLQYILDYINLFPSIERYVTVTTKKYHSAKLVRRNTIVSTKLQGWL